MSVNAGTTLSFGLENEENFVSWQQHYRLDGEKISASLAKRLDPLFADLIDLATAVYVSDRLILRRPYRRKKDGTHWRRPMHLRVAMRELERWADPKASEQLHRLLGWLTDDDWRIEFLPCPGGATDDTQERLFDDLPANPAQVALFSGGLDSLLGAAADAGGAHGELVLVGAGSQTRMIHRQRQLIDDLSEQMPRSLRSIIVPVGLTAAGKELGSDRREESSQRSRGFVFLSLGIAVAKAAGCDELRVHENGPGALNLPLTAAQQGSMNTRAARPETLAMMSELIRTLTGEPFRVHNPAFFSTKAEMCANAPSALGELIASSVSCDGGFTRRNKEAPLCGVCTSCLLRRQALLAGGLPDVDAADVEKMPGDGLAASRANANPMVLAMLNQARQLDRALSSDRPWEALLRRFPELGDARRALDVTPEQIFELLSRYVSDWRVVDYSLIREFLPRAGSGAGVTV